MFQIFMATILLAFAFFAGTYVGQYSIKENLCQEANGMFVKGKCYIGMTEKKLESKND